MSVMGKYSPQKLLITFVIVLVLQENVLAAVCRQGCPTPNKSSKYKFKPDTVYSYSLESAIAIQVVGNNTEETTLKAQGSFDVFAKGNCQYALQVTELKAENKKMDMKDIGGKIVQFTISNDELSPEICAEADDTEFSLNIKRGLISLFQSADLKSHETDIFGVCPTVFPTVEVKKDVTVVKKSRNLNKCSHRESLGSGIISTFFNEDSNIKSSPIIKSDYSNEQTIKGGIVANVQTEETYSFIPFSSTGTGSKAKVVTKVTLKGQKRGAVPKINKEQPKSILFKAPLPQTVYNPPAIKASLIKTLDSYTNNVGPTTAESFRDLIRVLRSSRKDSLVGIYNQVKSGSISPNKEMARKVFFGALYHVGTGDSIEVLIDLKSKELTQDELKMVYISFLGAQSVTKGAFDKISKLLDKGTPDEAFYSIGSLVNKYCSNNECTGPTVKAIMDKMIGRLNNCKAQNKKDETTMVSILRGIQNSKNLFEPHLDKVMACISDRVSSKLRVTAIQSLSASSCNPKTVETALNLLKNSNEDSEIRIHAFLTLMNCPSANTANEIKTLLDNEKVYQVGSYITTYLASLRASADPAREAAKLHFGQIRGTQKFPRDIRRYSFNNELSYAIAALGVGASVDTSVIYSQKSFLPRSATVNLTGELFGNRFNLIELSGRQENLDTLLEKYFGPKGLLKSKDMQQFYDDHVKKYLPAPEEVNNRARRSLNDVVDEYNLDLSLKLFGSEIPISPENVIDKLVNAVMNVVQTKSFDHKFEHHAQFLDIDLIYPTSAGLPMKLSALGNGAARLEINGALQGKDSHVKLVPSANILLTGSLIIDAQVISTGIEISGTVHSSTGNEVKIQILDENKGIDIKLISSVKRQEIFSFEHKTVFITRENGGEVKAVPRKVPTKVRFNDCFDQLQKVAGLNLCITTLLPDVSDTYGDILLSSGTKLGVALEMDPEYHFRIEANNADIQHETLTFLIESVSRPESKMNLFLEKHIMNDIYLKATLSSPLISGSIETGIKNNEQEILAYTKVVDGSGLVYSVRLGLEKIEPSVFKPIIQIMNADKDVTDALIGYHADGKIKIEYSPDGDNYIFEDLSIKRVGDEAKFSLGGQIKRTGSSYNTDLTLTDKVRKGNLKGLLAFKAGGVEIDYSLQSDIPGLHGRIKYDLEHTSALKHSLLVVYDKDLNSNVNRVILEQEYEYDYQDKKLKKIKFKNSFDAPFLPVAVKLNGEYKDKSFELALSYSCQKSKGSLDADIKYNMRTMGEYAVKIDATVDKTNVKLNSKHVIQSGKSTITNKLTTSFGTSIDINGVFSHKFTFKDADISLSAVVVPMSKQEAFKASVNLKNTEGDSKSDATISHGKIEYLSVKTGLTYGNNNYNGEFSINVKDQLSSVGTLVSTNGKGVVTILTELIPMNRKTKLESKFAIKEPMYDISTAFYSDFEKDDTKKIIYDTKTKIDKNGIDSKNDLEILSEKYAFNVLVQHYMKPENKKLRTKFDVTLPSTRFISANLDFEFARKDKNANGKYNLKFQDRHPDKKYLSIAGNGEMKSDDYKAGLVDATHSFIFTGYCTKTVESSLHIKKATKGEFKTALVHFKLGGTMVENPVDLSVDIDEYCPKHAIFHIATKAGGNLEVKVDGKYQVGAPGKEYSHELSVAVSTPGLEIKKVGLGTSGSFLIPEKADGTYEIKYNGGVSVDEKSASIEISGKSDANAGIYNIALQLPNQAPITVVKTYKREEKDGHSKLDTTFTLNYENSKTLTVAVDADYLKSKELTVHCKIQSEIGPVDLVLKYKISDGNTYSTDLTIEYRGETHTLSSILVLSMTKPSITIEMKCPDKTSKIHAGYEKIANKHFKVNGQIVNIAEMSVDTSLEVGYENLDKFFVRFELDSPNISQEKLLFELASRVYASKKTLELKAMKGATNLFSGSLDYNLKEMQGSTVFEGIGNVKVYDDMKPSNFKFIKNEYDAVKDGETGQSYVLNTHIGQSNMVAEVKVTDKSFAVKYTMCRAKQQCANIDIQSRFKKLNVGEGQNEFEHDLSVAIDLRQYGYTHEFGLNAHTSNEGYLIDHSLDLHLHADGNKKYQFGVYIKPDGSGVSLEIPKRIIASEINYKYPKAIYGPFDISSSFYLDKKNAPNNKISVGLVGQIDKLGNNGADAKAQLKISHPTIKTLAIDAVGQFDDVRQLITGQIDVDIFKRTEQKIVILGKFENAEKSGNGFNVSSLVSVKSPGLGINLGHVGHAALSPASKQLSIGASLDLPADNKYSSYLFVSPQEYSLIIKRLNEEITNDAGVYETDSGKLSLTATSKILGATPRILKLNINGYQSGKISIIKDPVNIEGAYEWNKQANFNVFGKGKELVKGTLYLDPEKFMETDYKANDAEINEFMTIYREEAKKERADLENEIAIRVEAITKEMTDVREKVIQALPDMTAFKNDFQKQLDGIKTDMVEDEVVKNIVIFVDKMRERYTIIADRIVNIYIESFTKIVEIVKELIENLVNIYNTSIRPALRDLIVQIELNINGIYYEIINFLTNMAEKLTSYVQSLDLGLGKYGDDIKLILSEMREIIKKTVEQIINELKDLHRIILDAVRQIPGVENLYMSISEQIQALPLEGTLLDLHKIVIELVGKIVQVPEFQELLSKWQNYITLKYELKDIENAEKQLEELKKIVWKALRATYESLVSSISSIDRKELYSRLPGLEEIKLLPQLFSMKFSPIDYILQGDFVPLKETIRLYRPYAWSAANLLPPFTMHGQIVDGSHYFTFDGRQFSFQGTCQYIVAQDFVNGNFTIAVKVDGGKIKSITLADKADSIEITSEGLVTLNGKANELPVHNADLHAWRDYYQVHLLTTYGVEISCNANLKHCNLAVSGYYLGKIRGLLGNGNNEPFDDFLLPNGKVSESVVEFGSAYSKVKTCQAVSEVEHKTGDEHDICRKFFSIASPLRTCFMFKNKDSYREACERSVHGAKDEKEGACIIAAAYASACLDDKIPVSIPEECQSCSVDGKSVAIGDTFSAKAPEGKADIVIIFDKAVDSDLITGIINDLRKELKLKDINDVNIAVIGYSQEEKYLSVYTTKGKLDVYGKIHSTKGPEHHKALATGYNRIDEYLQLVHARHMKAAEDARLLGDTQAFDEAVEYPFRPTASKSFIIIRKDEAGSSPTALVNTLLKQAVLDFKGISVHVVAPVKELAIVGKDSKKVKDIVGFNSKLVFTYTDTSAKRSNIGSSELRRNLKHESDVLVDLVDESNGITFVLQNYEEAKQPKRRQFVMALTAQVASQIATTEVQSECECGLTRNMYAKTSCIATDTKIIQPTPKIVAKPAQRPSSRPKGGPQKPRKGSAQG